MCFFITKKKTPTNIPICTWVGATHKITEKVSSGHILKKKKKITLSPQATIQCQQLFIKGENLEILCPSYSEILAALILCR